VVSEVDDSVEWLLERWLDNSCSTMPWDYILPWVPSTVNPICDPLVIPASSLIGQSNTYPVLFESGFANQYNYETSWHYRQDFTCRRRPTRLQTSRALLKSRLFRSHAQH